ncbi:MAG: DUF2752 domain-containing protein [Bacteroidota bacterium]
MKTARNRLYITLAIVSIAGIIWLLRNLHNTDSGNAGLLACPTKHLIGIPCPACGTTRAMESMLHGNILDSLMLNPLGLLAFLFLSIIPGWIFFDSVTGSVSFFRSYRKAEAFVRRPVLAIPLIALLLINWIWNVSKGI